MLMCKIASNSVTFITVSLSSRFDFLRQFTALHWASYIGDELIVEKLIEAGANVDVQDN